MAEKDKVFDVAVIGGGPGGYTAAIRASQLGLKAALVEAEPELGGVCLNWGCIPTKALLKQAELYRLIQRAGEFGLTVGEVGYDWDRLIARSREISGGLARGVRFLMKKNRVAVFGGRGRLTPGRKVAVESPDGKRDPGGGQRHPGDRRPPALDSRGGDRRGKGDLEPRGHGAGETPGPDRHHRGRGDRGGVRLVLQRLRRRGPSAGGGEPGAAARGRGGRGNPGEEPFRGGDRPAHRGVGDRGGRGRTGNARLVPGRGGGRGSRRRRRADGGRGDRQHRGAGTGGERRQDQARSDRRQRPHGDQRQGDLRHRRRRRGPAARPRGLGRSGRRGRVHRRQATPRDRSGERSQLHLLPAPGRQRRADRGGGRREGAEGQGRPLSLRRQRQGAGRRRDRGHGEAGVRRGVRGAGRGLDHRRRGDRA